MPNFAENYRASDLTFDENGIYWVNPDNNETYQVMMGWETPIMQKMAELCVSEGDDVLEIGFGMGILSDAIQARKPKSHTIIECHKDIIPKLKEWASNKSNVTVVEGLWVNKLIDMNIRGTVSINHGNPIMLRDMAKKIFTKFDCMNLLSLGSIVDPEDDNYKRKYMRTPILRDIEFRDTIPALEEYLDSIL